MAIPPLAASHANKKAPPQWMAAIEANILGRSMRDRGWHR